MASAPDPQRDALRRFHDVNRHSIMLLWASLVTSVAAGVVVSLQVGLTAGACAGLLLLAIVWGALGPLSLLSATGAEDSSRALERARARRAAIRSNRVDRRRGQVSVWTEAGRGCVSDVDGDPGP